MPNDSAEPLIGVINAGSSSLKFSFYEGERRLLSGQVDGIGVRPAAQAVGPDGKAIAPPDFAGHPPASPSEVLPAMLPWAREQLGERRLAALGHRVVHGGARHSKPARVTPELLDELEALVPLAPLHEPHNLAPIRMALTMNPELPQVACFDTAFHRTAPEVAQAFALPYALYEEGIRRYGFHGLSYEYIASVLPERAPEIAGGRVVVAHLGNGCSACAMEAGRSVATTMGFTALDGLPMGTRSGALDPGVVLYLIQQKGMTADAVTDLLYRRSGMLGMSGVSSDFRELAGKRGAARPFCRRVRSATGRRARSPRSRRRSAGLTGSSLPPASARTPHRSGPRSAAPALGSASSWTRRPTLCTGPASRLTPAASARMSSRPTRT